MISNISPQLPISVTYQMSTNNESFLMIHYYLHNKGITNDKFFLILYDSDLAGVNPRDPNLNLYIKRKILAEVLRNYWYFIREVVVVPDAGGTVGSGQRYRLTRANLALNFGFTLNWNMFLEIPRQQGKTISAIVWYLYNFVYTARNSEFLFFNKKLDDSKLNLQRLKDIRSALPEYLQLDARYATDGSKLKAQDSVESISNPATLNRIKTTPSARNKILANSIGRGCTCPFLWYDEYAFIPYNYIIYSAAAPAFSTASENARKNRGSYGMLITTTPGDLLTDEGNDADDTRKAATPFSEIYYNSTLQELEELRMANTKSNFFYIRFTYKQLGMSEEWFDNQCKDLKMNGAAIRRELLLEWNAVATSSPFDPMDLEAIKCLVREPIRQMMVGSARYLFNVYEDIHMYNNPPIVGVDVAGGYSKDASAITVIDSRSTNVCADFNCNYIPINDLAKVIYELVSKYMPNAIVNIERNGGFGASVISYLLTSSIKKNLYFEIKDRVCEESFDGLRNVKTTKRVKVYGLNETHETRDLIMEILKERVKYFKAKFVSKRIYDELCELEMKKNGRIEHSSNGHDDQIFSYLLALYVWYEGKDVLSNWGFQKRSVRTDEDFDEMESITPFSGSTMQNIAMEMVEDESQTEVKEQIKILNASHSVAYADFIKNQEKSEKETMINNFALNPLLKKAFLTKYHTSEDEIGSIGMYSFSDKDMDLSGDSDNDIKDPLNEEFAKIMNLR